MGLLKNIGSWFKKDTPHPPDPLFEKRVRNLPLSLTGKKENQTLSYIVQHTGWPKSEVIPIVKHLVSEKLLIEELDLETGQWFYFVPNSNESLSSHLNIDELEKQLKEHE